MNQNQRMVSWLPLPAALVISTVPAAAQVFATEAQALQAAFGNSASILREEKRLSEADRRALEERTSIHFPEPAFLFFVAQRSDQVTGYAVVMNEIGKSEPITFLVVMSPEGKVTDVVVMVFRESRGGEVREQRFVRQFRGKKVSDPIQVNRDILNYTGATLSSSAIARGVKRALILLDHFYPPPRKQPLSSGQRVTPMLPTARASHGGLGLYIETHYLMGTLCEVRLWAESPWQAAGGFSAAFAELRRLDHVFSNYRPDSEVSRINREAASAPIVVSQEVWQLTHCAVEAWQRTRSAFDVTVGPLLKAWGFWQREPRVPSRQAVAEALRHVGSDKLQMDARSRTIRFARPGMELDFGGLAKGYAARRAAEKLCGWGVHSAAVNLGESSLYCLGRPPEGRWLVGLTSPLDTGRTNALLEVSGNQAISTSGTYRNCFESGEHSFSHLFDPHTGLPLQGHQSATVISRSGVRAEVLSKVVLFTPSKPRGRRAEWLHSWGEPGSEARWLFHLRSSGLWFPENPLSRQRA